MCLTLIEQIRTISPPTANVGARVSSLGTPLDPGFVRITLAPFVPRRPLADRPGLDSAGCR